MADLRARRFDILVLNAISANGLKRLPAERYTVGKDFARPDAGPTHRFSISTNARAWEK